MKKKVVREVEVVVKVVESKRLFKLSVEDDVRLKTIANKLCRLMDLDPFCTEWAFYANSVDPYEIPISFTIRQIQNGRRVPTLLAKIMSTALKQDYFVDTKIGWKTDTNWRRRIESGQTILQETGIQTDPVDQVNEEMSKEPNWHPGSTRTSANTDALGKTGLISTQKQVKPRVIYTMYGIQKPVEKAAAYYQVEAPDVSEIWQNLKKIEESQVLRGLNVVGYCPNKKCINYCRWISVSLGFGRYTFSYSDLLLRRLGR